MKPEGPHPPLGAVHIVIVNYRTPDLVADCLRALRDPVLQRPGTRVVVVDNASGDGSDDRIEQAIQALDAGGWARLVRSPVNGGFGAGNNLAIRQALADDHPPAAFWLLNPDTRPEPGALEALVRALEANPRCGLAGSLLINADGSPWPYAFNWPSWQGELEANARLRVITRVFGHRALARAMPSGDHDPPSEADWLSGASMLVRTSMLEQVGLMDEAYFLYFEETDLAWRARQAGWCCLFVPQSRVLHLSGQSTGITGDGNERRRRPRYWFDSRALYFTRCHGPAYAFGADVAALVGLGLWHLARLVRLRPNTDPPYFTTDLVLHAISRIRGKGRVGQAPAASPITR